MTLPELVMTYVDGAESSVRCQFINAWYFSNGVDRDILNHLIGLDLDVKP